MYEKKELEKLRDIDAYWEEIVARIKEHVADAKQESEIELKSEFRKGISYGTAHMLSILQKKDSALCITLDNKNLVNDLDQGQELLKLRILKEYVIDTIEAMKDYAITAEKRRRGNWGNEFLAGTAIGALTTISIIQNQFLVLQDTIEVPILKELHLDDIDPEGDPLGEKRKSKQI